MPSEDSECEACPLDGIVVRQLLQKMQLLRPFLQTKRQSYRVRAICKKSGEFLTFPQVSDLYSFKFI
jgi:hypothetical protein